MCKVPKKANSICIPYRISKHRQRPEIRHLSSFDHAKLELIGQKTRIGSLKTLFLENFIGTTFKLQEKSLFQRGPSNGLLITAALLAKSRSLLPCNLCSYTTWARKFLPKTAVTEVTNGTISAVKLPNCLVRAATILSQSIHKWIEHLELLFLEFLWFVMALLCKSRPQNFVFQSAFHKFLCTNILAIWWLLLKSF